MSEIQFPGQGRTRDPWTGSTESLDHPRPALELGGQSEQSYLYTGIEGRKGLAPDWASEDLHEFWREKDGRVER